MINDKCPNQELYDSASLGRAIIRFRVGILLSRRIKKHWSYGNQYDAIRNGETIICHISNNLFLNGTSNNIDSALIILSSRIKNRKAPAICNRCDAIRKRTQITIQRSIVEGQPLSSPLIINSLDSMWHESTKLLIHTRACSWELVHRNLPVRTFGSGNISTF